METDSYLGWLVSQTPTRWWHDSGNPDELDLGLAYGACGVTTNPVLAYQALRAQVERWRPIVGALGKDLDRGTRAERLMNAVVRHAASKLEPHYRASSQALGYVCAQVNPAKAGDRESMLAMAHRFHAWAPNIAVKLPVTAAGLDVLEECVAQGITVTATVSFTVPQVLAVAERHRQGSERARRAKVVPGRCFAVIMIGRLDDYLRDVAWDSRADVTEEDIRVAGLAVTKRAYETYQAAGYEAVLLVAALRGTYHTTELAGGRLILSIHPTQQARLRGSDLLRDVRIGLPIPSQAIERLHRMPEFRRAFEPDGMKPEEFIGYGVTQRTLSQFAEAGWALLEALDAF